MCLQSSAADRGRAANLMLPGLILAAVAGAAAGALYRPDAFANLVAPSRAENLRIIPAPLATAPQMTPQTTPETPPLAGAPLAAGFAAPGVQPLDAKAAESPAFDCAEALGAAETLICSDPRLAAADRRMARAFRNALTAGAPAWRLRRDQRDWTAARDLAARESPGDLPLLYQQRIEELEALAAGAPPAD